MTQSSKIPLQSIAERAGVSKMAVSLALRGKSGVSDATRRKVQKIAKQMGYQPDPEVSNLMARIRAKQSSETQACIALLTSGTQAESWRKSITERKYVTGAFDRAREYGYRVELFWIYRPGITPKRLSDILWSRGIEGVIVAPLQGPLTRGETRSFELTYEFFSLVEISETIDWPDLHRAIHDQYTALLKCLYELERLGYQRIGMVLETGLDRRVNHKWSAAYLETRHRRGSRQFPPLLLLEHSDLKAFQTWFDKYKPDAIVSVNRFGYEMIRQAKLRIPRDIAYATLDRDELHPKDPDVSGIDQNSSMVGAAAVDMIVSAIQRSQKGVPDQPVRSEIEGTWIQGSTTPKRKQPSR